MNAVLEAHISKYILGFELTETRKRSVQPLIVYIQEKINRGKAVNLHFICTHNSRRSHLAQIWTQVAAHFYGIPNIHCYSGGTEETALFPTIVQTLIKQGFEIQQMTESENPLYEISFDINEPSIIAFSKRIDHASNPSDNFTSIMTCSQADEACPFISGADLRIPLTYDDPKISDGTSEQMKVYLQRSTQIAQEMFYVFGKIL